MTMTDRALPPTKEELFVDPRSLPSPSVSVLEIVRRADDPEVAMGEIARLIESDVGVAVQVLRMANSALYSPAREITTVNRALAALGLRTVKLLALTTSLRSLVPSQADSIDLSPLRHRMVVTAAIARRAAGLVSPAHKEEAFVAGLLTGIGPVVLATAAPAATRAMLGDDGSWPDPETEQRVLGYTTDEISVELISLWGLPSLFGEAVSQRRSETPLIVDPDQDDPTAEAVASSLQIATLAEPVLTGRDSGAALADLRVALAEIASFDEEDVTEWLVESQTAVAEVATMLQVRMPSDVSYRDLLDEVSDRLLSLQASLEGETPPTSEVQGELLKRNNELETQATTDALTGLPNRRAFDQKVEALMSSCSPAVGLLMLDVDHFKRVNDMHGHSVGDDVLTAVGATLQRQTRGSDLTARYGGEEFVMLLAATDTAALQAIAERLRIAVSELRVPVKNGSTVSVTASIGGVVVSSAPNINSPRSLIDAADEQLYQAKQGGRNRSCVV